MAFHVLHSRNCYKSYRNVLYFITIKAISLKSLYVFFEHKELFKT